MGCLSKTPHRHTGSTNTSYVTCVRVKTKGPRIKVESYNETPVKIFLNNHKIKAENNHSIRQTQNYSGSKNFFCFLKHRSIKDSRFLVLNNTSLFE